MKEYNKKISKEDKEYDTKIRKQALDDYMQIALELARIKWHMYEHNFLYWNCYDLINMVYSIFPEKLNKIEEDILTN